MTTSGAVGPLWFTESDVTRLLGLPDVYDALLATLDRQRAGTARPITKAMGDLVPEGSLHSLGAVDNTDQLCGFKNWINTPTGAQALYQLFDAREGRLVASISAGALGAMRTAATAAAGTAVLANPATTAAALIGTGRQALAQAAALALVLPLTRLHVWSPDRTKRDQFATLASKILGFDVVACTSPAEALDGVGVVTTMTRAADPILHAADLPERVHVNAMGSILPTYAEVAPDVFTSATTIVVDDPDSAALVSRELRDAASVDPTLLGRIVPLHEAWDTTGPVCARTVFKSVGTGLADLAAATALYRSAIESGANLTTLPVAPPGLPRLARR